MRDLSSAVLDSYHCGLHQPFVILLAPGNPGTPPTCFLDPCWPLDPFSKNSVCAMPMLPTHSLRGAAGSRGSEARVKGYSPP